MAEHEMAVKNVRNIKFQHNSLIAIQKEFATRLTQLLENIIDESRIVKHDIVWDHLVVGFFGETNAGKSTIIETLRLKYGTGERNWVHGAIVGDGQADFTKDASEYELNLNGKHVTLIDIPGIEGDESKYASIIKKALRRAHYVFYVHCKRQQPDEKIASRIKEYLADWTQVYSIMNVSGRPGNYDEPEERETLLTSEVVSQDAVIQDAFRKTLGDLYQSNIPLQALIALASCSDFPENQSLNSASLKLKRYFGDAESAYQFSNMEALVKVLEQSNDVYEEIISNSQMQKLQALKLKSRKKLKEFEIQNTNQLNDLTERLESLRSDIKNEFNSTKSRLKRVLDSIIDSQFSHLLSKCHSIIDSKENSEKVKSKVMDQIRQFPYRLNSMLIEKTDDLVKKLSNYLVKRFSEFRSINIGVPNFDFDFRISIDIDIDEVIEQLKISFGDVLDVGVCAATGAGVCAFGGPIGSAIGAGIGLALGIVKKAVFGDGGKAEAKESIKKEIDVCRSETKNHLNEVKFEICRELEKIQSRLIKQVQTEISNIEDLKKERLQLYILLRK